MTELATMAATQEAPVSELFGVYGEAWLADTAAQEKDSQQEETQETTQDRK